MTDIDLRHEPTFYAHNRTSAAIQGDRVGLLNDANFGLLHDDDEKTFSENTKRTRAQMTGERWVKFYALADKLDAGDGDQSNDEQDTLYEGFPVIVDTAIDLFNMLARRDARIADLEREVQAYVEAEAGESL